MNTRCAIVAALAIVPAAAASDRVKPDEARQTVHATDAKRSAREWQITSYLHGDADALRQQLKREVSRLAQLYNEKSQSLRETVSELESDTKRRLVLLGKTDNYRQAAEELRQAKEDYEAAHRLDDSQARVRSSSRLNKAKAAVARMEKDAVAEDREITKDYKRITAIQQEQADIKRSLIQALQWRNHVVSVTRNDCLLKWPVVGEKGTLGTVRPVAVDGRGIVVDAEIYEEVSPARPAGEGFAETLVRTHHVRLHISGMHTGSFELGKPACVDVTFKGTRILAPSDDGKEQFAIERQPDDEDYLFQQIDDLPPNLKRTLEMIGLAPAEIQPLPEPLQSANPRNPSDPANKSDDPR